MKYFNKIFFSFIIAMSLNGFTYGKEVFGDYTVKKNDFISASTRGSVINGHQLIILRKPNTDKVNIIISLSTTSNDLPKNGMSLDLKLVANEHIHQMQLKASKPYELGTLKILCLQISDLKKALLEDLKAGTTLKITVTGDNAKFFDLQEEQFSLKGFTASFLKVIEHSPSLVEWNLEPFSHDLDSALKSYHLQYGVNEVAQKNCKSSKQKQLCYAQTIYNSLLYADLCKDKFNTGSCMTKYAKAHSKSSSFMKKAISKGSSYEMASVKICSPISEYTSNNATLIELSDALNRQLEGRTQSYDWVELNNCITEVFKEISIRGLRNKLT